jgi:hypothetical protein
MSSSSQVFILYRQRPCQGASFADQYLLSETHLMQKSSLDGG